RAHAVLTEVLLDLDDDVDLLAPGVTGHAHGVIDGGQATGELDVDDGPDDLNDLADLHCFCDCHYVLRKLRTSALELAYCAWAPDTTSMISRVIAAWRTLFMV